MRIEHWAAISDQRWVESSITDATEAVRFLPVLMCKNSFGPWALLSGPRTPVIRNCALGNFSPSIPMKGMEPPSPYEHALLPKKVVDAFSTERSSQGTGAGASQPAAALILSKRTWAP